jgi:glycosyltransferase involved in cell wall biosynthesis
VTFPLRRDFFWRRARRVIAISAAVRDSLLADGLEPDRVVVIPSALDPGHTEATAVPDIRTQLGLPLKGQVVVSLGGLTPEKGQMTLVEAAGLLVRDLPNLHWIIVGEGPLRPILEQRIADLGLQPRFHLPGQLVDPHLALQGADVYVLSSTAEGLGSSLLAAMALDVPVVATRVGGIPDILGTGGGLLVAPENPPEFAAAVRAVLGDLDLRGRLIQVARGELERFSLEAVAERVLAVYRSCDRSPDTS